MTVCPTRQAVFTLGCSMRRKREYGGTAEDQKEAADFIKDMDFYIENFKAAKDKGLVYETDAKKAEAFYVWWKECRYADNPHVLIFLHEKWLECLKSEPGELQDVFNVITGWLCQFDNIVKENY